MFLSRSLHSSHEEKGKRASNEHIFKIELVTSSRYVPFDGLKLVGKSIKSNLHKSTGVVSHPLSNEHTYL
jgi:hypothetical protein